MEWSTRGRRDAPKVKKGYKNARIMVNEDQIPVRANPLVPLAPVGAEFGSTQDHAQGISRRVAPPSAVVYIAVVMPVREFDAELQLFPTENGGRKRVTPADAWRCDLGVGGSAPMGSQQNPLHGCKMTYAGKISPGAEHVVVHVVLATPLEQLPDFFTVFAGRAIGVMRPVT